jgi:DUF4097 and DUF4098 domain-containing protein YvlB
MFYEKIAILTGVCALMTALFGASTHSWNSEAREAIHHTFTGDKSLDADVVNGSIEVVGDNGNTIRAEGERIIRALDQPAIDRAKREVTLDINEKDGVAQLCVNGPFRDNGRSSADHGFHIHFDSREYEVTYNLTIHVPHNTELRLHTVNGEIQSEQTNGKFDVNNVNGGIVMTDIAGAGRVKTVNGKTTVTFRENPKAETNFQSVNGFLDVTFQPGLAADLHFKTVNGAAYTDFDVTALASAGPLPQRRNGGLVYRSDHGGSVRVGAGGPALNFQTVNGDIRIRKQGN